MKTIKIGKTVFLVNETFNDDGKNLKELLEKLILYKAQQRSA